MAQLPVHAGDGAARSHGNTGDRAVGLAQNQGSSRHAGGRPGAAAASRNERGVYDSQRGGGVCHRSARPASARDGANYWSENSVQRPARHGGQGYHTLSLARGWREVGLVPQVVVISGCSGAVQSACEKVRECVKKVEEKETQVSVGVPVPVYAIGRLIGRGGANIRAIQRESGAKVSLIFLPLGYTYILTLFILLSQFSSMLNISASFISCYSLSS